MSMFYQVLKSFLGQLSKERLKAWLHSCLALKTLNPRLKWGDVEQRWWGQAQYRVYGLHSCETRALRPWGAVRTTWTYWFRPPSRCLFTTHWSAWSQCLLPQQNEWQNLQKWDAEVSMCDLGSRLCFRLHDLQYRIPHTLGSGALCLGGIFQFFGITKPAGKE